MINIQEYVALELNHHNNKREDTVTLREVEILYRIEFEDCKMDPIEVG